MAPASNYRGSDSSLCGLCDGQSGTEIGFSGGTSGFQSVSFHTCISRQHYINRTDNDVA